MGASKKKGGEVKKGEKNETIYDFNSGEGGKRKKIRPPNRRQGKKSYSMIGKVAGTQERETSARKHTYGGKR